MNGLTKEEKEELMNSMYYRECDIIYKSEMYHIENCSGVMTIGRYLPDRKSIEAWIEIDEGDFDKTFEKFLHEPIFDNKCISEILDDLKVYSMR